MHEHLIGVLYLQRWVHEPWNISNGIYVSIHCKQTKNIEHCVIDGKALVSVVCVCSCVLCTHGLRYKAPYLQSKALHMIFITHFFTNSNEQASFHFPIFLYLWIAPIGVNNKHINHASPWAPWLSAGWGRSPPPPSHSGSGAVVGWCEMCLEMGEDEVKTTHWICTLHLWRCHLRSVEAKKMLCLSD